MFIRINPDEKFFSVFKEIKKIHRYIKKSTKKLLIDDLSKRLLELEFEKHNSIKSKRLKWTVKKYCQIIKNEKYTNKNKTNKTKKKT